MSYSVVTYTGDGVTTSFAIPFPFISRDHITARVNGIARTISWINNGLIQLSPAPSNGAQVLITRDSSRTVPLVDFQDAQLLTAADLDLGHLQNLYVAQEAFDASDSSIVASQVAADAAAAASSATNAANSATSAAASANNAANSATAAATSATAAAASAASIGDVWYKDLGYPTQYTQSNFQMDVIVADGSDYGAAPQAYSMRFCAASTIGGGVAVVPDNKLFTPLLFEGNYLINHDSVVCCYDVNIQTDVLTHTNTELYGTRFNLHGRASNTNYGFYANLDMTDVPVGTPPYAYPMYLKVTANGLQQINGALLTLHVDGSGTGTFNGQGIEIKATGTALSSFTHGIAVRESVRIGQAAFQYTSNAASPADVIRHGFNAPDAQDGFVVNSDGSIMFGAFSLPRVFADGSNAQHNFRMMFQDAFAEPRFGASNSPMFVGAKASGTSHQAGFNVYGNEDADNSHYGSFNTGIIANTIGIDSAKTGTGTTRDVVVSFNGAEKARFTSVGDFGINCPATDLWSGTISSFQIKGRSAGALIKMMDSTAATVVHMFADINGFSFSTLNSTRLSFGTNSTERIYVGSAGKVGIGTWGVVPACGFSVLGPSAGHVDGTSGIMNVTTGTASTDEMMQFGVVNGSYAWIQALKSGTSYRPIVLNPASGNVLIGTITDNGQKLQVNGKGIFTASGVTDALAVVDTGASGANIKITGDGAVTPSKFIRSKAGALEFIDNGYANIIASLTDAGQFNAKTGFSTNGTAVVGTRKTGWGAPTGTATRTTFATSTVTLPLLAERVKALIDDLTSHGLIGA